MSTFAPTSDRTPSGAQLRSWLRGFPRLAAYNSGAAWAADQLSLARADIFRTSAAKSAFAAVPSRLWGGDVLSRSRGREGGFHGVDGTSFNRLIKRERVRHACSQSLFEGSLGVCCGKDALLITAA